MAYIPLVIVPIIFSFIFINMNISASVDAIVVVNVVLPILCYIFSFITTLTCIINNIVDHGSQIEDIENITQYGENKIIYQKRAKNLSAEFKKYLVEKYPDYEKEILEKVMPDNVSILITEFPNIKSSETIESYCSKLNSLMDDVYKQELDINSLKAKIRRRRRSLWIFKYFAPDN